MSMKAVRTEALKMQFKNNSSMDFVCVGIMYGEEG